MHTVNEDRPYTLLSCGISIDGYLDSTQVKRLQLSNEADFDRVDSMRAKCDAILVGAATVRNDNPRLIVRSEHRQRERARQGLPASPAKVTITATGELDPASAFFAVGSSDKFVYCSSSAYQSSAHQFGAVATVVEAGDSVSMRGVSEDLAARGVRRLMVEGGGRILTQFLTGDLADELHLVVAPFFVGDSAASRFVHDGSFPWHPARRAKLVEARQIDDVVLLRYALSERFCATEFG